MKKTFLLAATLLGMSSAAMAQSSIDTYDACDANLNGEIMVDDATTVVNRVLGKASGSEVVKAEDLNAVLQLISSRLAAIEEKLGIETPATPDANGVISNGHDYVDLGLKDSEGRTIYWATCNVGAKSPEDYGLYFAWGDTEGHSSNKTNGTQPDGYSYDWSTTPFNNGSSNYDESYFATVKDEVCPNGVLAPKYDAAHVQWGGDWRMPTLEEQDALRTQCTWTWDSAKKGYTVKGSNGKTIFLPASGYRNDLCLNYAGSGGYYWSSSLNASYPSYAYYLGFNSSDLDRFNYSRFCGHSVRPVLCSAE